MSAEPLFARLAGHAIRWAAWMEENEAWADPFLVGDLKEASEALQKLESDKKWLVRSLMSARRQSEHMLATIRQLYESVRAEQMREIVSGDQEREEIIEFDETLNQFGVSVTGSGDVAVLIPPVLPIPKQAAIIFAAWLAVLAGDHDGQKTIDAIGKIRKAG